jgi:sortase A
MFRSLKSSVLVVVLGVLGLAALPIFPITETASVELRPAEAEGGRALLGENLSGGGPLASTSREVEKGDAEEPFAGELMLSVPRLGLRDVRVPTSSSQVELDRKGIIRLEGTGVPSKSGSNTFIVGHAIGYLGGLYPYVFYELDRLRPGDEVFLEDSTGWEYAYRVYDRVIVRPADYWVTYPVPGKTIVSLQGSYPVPTFERRLIVRAELVSQDSPDETLGGE